MITFNFLQNQLWILSILFSISFFAQENENAVYITSNIYDKHSEHIIEAIIKSSKVSKANNILMIVGNTVSKESRNDEDSRDKLTDQLNKLSNFNGEILFLPGSNEWNRNGYKGVQEIEKLIQKNSRAKFYPNKGCPIKKENLSENAVLISIDSQWYLEDWDKYPYINNDCDIKNRNQFYLELESLFKKADGKIKIVALHHSVVTNSHAGILKKTSGIGKQNFYNKNYREFRNRITTFARQSKDVIFISGNDRNLQLIDYFNVYQIISGSTSKRNQKATSKKENEFASSNTGYAILNLSKKGEVTLIFNEVKNNISATVFSEKIIAKNDQSSVSFAPQNNFGKTYSASVYNKNETSKGKLYRKLWGNHYREYFSKEVSAPVAFLDTLLGGLTPIRTGGGHQSKSLRLKDKNGKQYVMRALRKSAVKFLQSTAFKDKFIEEKLKGSTLDKLLLDFYTTVHPYTPFVVGSLSESVGIYHTNPALYYVPKQKALGEFNDDYGDELYMIEERVESNHFDLKSFGKPQDIISTNDVLSEVIKNGKSHVDEASYIRARLFDMLIGDWDRHEDQWRWGVFTETNGLKTYKPIPRDRDQAFSIYDGSLIAFLKFAIPEMRMFQSFETDLKNVKWFNVEPYPLDKIFIHESTWKEWEKQASYLQEHLTDVAIDQAFEKIPSEMKGKIIDKIKSNLKGRKNNILNIAKRYFEHLNKTEIILGTQKSDVFKITRMSKGKTKISVNRKDIGILNKVFSKDITKEIWIYGLDGKDEFFVSGEGDNLIKIRVIGGKKNDVYDFKNTRRIKLYDYKTRKNTIKNPKSKKWLVDSYEINNYDYKKKKYIKNQFFPVIGANPDDGFKIGFLNTLTTYGIQRNPFTSQHKIGAAFFSGNSGYELSYSGEFSNIFYKWNFGVEGSYTSPNFAMNFFGSGNETDFDNDEIDLDFNRVRIQQFKAAISLKWRGKDGGYFDIKPLFESFEVENTIERFINTIPATDDVFDQQNYGGIEANYSYKNRNSRSFPTLGMEIAGTVGYKTGLDSDNDNEFAYVASFFDIDFGLISSGDLVFASRIGGEAILGENFEFFHGATIGGNHSLRGFRNERFNGKYSFYHNTDLRLRLGKSKASFLPVKFGLTGGFDYGRVWIENENSNTLHTSVGGSFWISGLEVFAANVGYYNSTDGGRVVFTLGFEF